MPSVKAKRIVSFVDSSSELYFVSASAVCNIIASHKRNFRLWVTLYPNIVMFYGYNSRETFQVSLRMTKSDNQDFHGEIASVHSWRRGW